ncbi:RidA family protein [Cloacibacillus evryensis]|uniref:RidA family protein n=1 Tax=Cloacibacillus evryensis TaxID=508460 RepID=UPI00054D91A7|nr:RidA family protein [Cloacibacillus evryensis]MEA5036478.1 RidA family protein [Cloacibacillus evryensis]
MKTVIKTPTAPEAIGPYSQAILAGNLIFTSGQLPITPASGALVENDITAQTNQAIKNLEAVLLAAGASLSSVVKTSVFIADMTLFPVVNEVYSKYFAENAPARSCVEVSALPKGALIEIEAVAVRQ